MWVVVTHILIIMQSLAGVLVMHGLVWVLMTHGLVWVLMMHGLPCVTTESSALLMDPLDEGAPLMGQEDG